MHEMAVITDIIDVICQEAKEASAERIVSVTLNVGEIRDFHEELVQSYFDWFAKGTPAEGATIIMNTIPLHYRCMECGEEYHFELSTMTSENVADGRREQLESPRCFEHPAAEVRMVSGNELFIDDLMVE